MAEEDYIELRSEDVQEIMGRPPSWIVRWGTVLIFFILCILIYLSYIIKYPDKISESITITTSVPPIKVVSHLDGYIEDVLVKENQIVVQDEVLLIVKNDAEYEEMMLLSSLVDSLILQEEVQSAYSYIKFPRGLILGDVQSSYERFLKDLEEYNFNRNDKYGEAKSEDIRNKIISKQEEIIWEEKRLEKAKETLGFAKKNFQTQRKAYEDKKITLAGLQQSKLAENNAAQAVLNIEVSIKKILADIKTLNRQIPLVTGGIVKSNTEKFNNVKGRLNTLKATILDWKKRNLIRSPSDGKVQFFTNGEPDKILLKPGTEIMAIVPHLDKQKVGKMALTFDDFGKVLEGQRVIIKFAAYPHQDFGVVEGKIAHKASLPQGNKYMVEIELPNGLLSSHGKELTFEQQMNGIAEIITEEHRFITRIFDKFTSFFNDDE